MQPCYILVKYRGQGKQLSYCQRLLASIGIALLTYEVQLILHNQVGMSTQYLTAHVLSI